MFIFCINDFGNEPNIGYDFALRTLRFFQYWKFHTKYKKIKTNTPDISSSNINIFVLVSFTAVQMELFKNAQQQKKSANV